MERNTRINLIELTVDLFVICIAVYAQPNIWVCGVARNTGSSGVVRKTRRTHACLSPGVAPKDKRN